MKFLADENIPLQVCESLRKDGFDIKHIATLDSGAEDRKIISLAEKESRIILTFDKDFGELVFRQKAKVTGIILLRFPPKSLNFILQKLISLLKMKELKIEGSFLVVEEERIRVRKLE